MTTHEFSLDREAAQARLLAERGIDGLVLVGHTHRPELQRLLAVRDLPHVTTYAYEGDLDHPAIGFDNAGAMGEMVCHLLDLGHRDFGLLCGRRREDDCVEARVSGALSTRRRTASRSSRSAWSKASSPSGPGGPPCATCSRVRVKPPPLVCTSDILPQGALVEMPGPRHRGAVADVDHGVRWARQFGRDPPRLDHLVGPGRGDGATAVFLAARSSREQHGSRVALATRLVLRDTVAPPPP